MTIQQPEMTHTPVMLQEVLTYVRPGPGLFIDSTFGRGGYTKALLNAHNALQVLAIDRDAEAIAWGQKHFADDIASGRLILFHRRFSNLQEAAAPFRESVQGIIFDLGVSSPQLENAARGFSFSHTGPLDMGMGLNTRSIADFLNKASLEDIQEVIHTFGEERYARRIAKKIVEKRSEQPLRTTRDLVNIIDSLLPHKKGQIHPATRTFQALRIWVNEELSELRQALSATYGLLAWGRPLVAVSFHSLEDRTVKHFLNPHKSILTSRHLPQQNTEQGLFQTPGRQPIRPQASEVNANPRARSARLRWGNKQEVLGHA